jgi:hypothetical protein
MAWRNTALRLTWWSLGISCAAVAILWLVWQFTAGPLRARAGDVAILFLPALAIASLVSGGPHDLNPFVWFVAQVVQTFLMTYAVGLGIVAARHVLRRREPVP